MTSFMTSPKAIDVIQNDLFPYTFDKYSKEAQEVAHRNSTIRNVLDEYKNKLTKEIASNKVMKKIIARVDLHKVDIRKKSFSITPERIDLQPINTSKGIYKSIVDEKFFQYLGNLFKCDKISGCLELTLKESPNFLTYDYLNIIIIDSFVKKKAEKGRYCKKVVDSTKYNILVVSQVPDNFGEPYFNNVNDLRLPYLK